MLGSRSYIVLGQEIQQLLAVPVLCEVALSPFVATIVIGLRSLVIDLSAKTESKFR